MEQLENLVKLMEELSELRDQNCMLKRKVRVLEDLKQGRQQQPPPPPPPRPEAHKDRLRVVPDMKMNFPLGKIEFCGPQVPFHCVEHRFHRLVDGFSRNCHQELDRNRHQQRKQFNAKVQ